MRHEFRVLQIALEDEKPYEMLVLCVIGQIEQGRDRQEILKDLQDLRVPDQEEGEDEPESMLLHVMDRLCGWCPPGMAL
jgi:hypothetical protein